MLYFDTSFLTPLILPERTSEKIAAFFRDFASEELAISHWTRVEFSSLIARKVRMNGLSAPDATQADAQFEAMVSQSFLVFTLNADDFDLAKQFLARFDAGLRAGDALHLAIAQNHRAKMIYSLDKAMLKAGTILGLPMHQGI